MEAMQNFVQKLSHGVGGISNETVRDLLGRSKVAVLRKEEHGGTVACLGATQTVGEALQLLGQKKVMSAPVMGVGCGGQMDDVLGFCDLKDILISFLEGLNLQQVQGEKLMHRMRDLEEKGAAFAATQLKDLKHLGSDGDFIHSTQAKSGSLLEIVLKCFIEPRTSCSSSDPGKKPSIVHRVACFDSQGRVTHIISQSDIVKFLSSHVPALGDVASKSVSELGLVGKKLETVRPETPAIDAFAQCTSKRLSGLPIVDSEGHLLGNFGITDLRSINPEHFGALALPVAELLALEHHTEFTRFNRRSSDGGPPARHRFVEERQKAHAVLGRDVGQTLLVVKPDSKLVEVLDLLAKRRSHRVYIVDNDDKPVGVVTCTDVLSLALRH
ncbi:CBS-domain-containing protein [Dunaliella salina]|uniref:CBS-domain-containing protein n=1 Tax=Dunaliella salina TaxID=3046 RepID=A0ABQ7G951_DUNSA|nr:CBS-domain-containing protein [Dunaliella salina]|eukprot:KAF5831127.1 CBS-domain-containing protein [Dunaliella salina]